MRFARRTLIWGTAAVALAAAPARAHVAPGRAENNRYVKVLPFADRVRLAYTIFYGDAPGRALRQQLDADHDGAISEAEAQTFADRVAADVAAHLELLIDGAPAPVVWAAVTAGLGVPSASAGAWSIDLVAWPCSAGRGGAHDLRLRDRFDLPLAGETEVWVVDMPGVTITRARLGELDDATHDFQFTGASPELARDGLELAYTADAHAGPGSAGACEGRDAPPRALGPWAGVAAAAVGGALGLGALAWTRRRRRAPAG